MITIDALLEKDTIDKSIFNTEKNYEEDNGSLFLQAEPGLFDSIHVRHPRLVQLYDLLAAQNLKANEFNYRECQAEFETGDPDAADLIMCSLAWQWETDSIAANNIVTLFAPFISSTEMSQYILEVGRNEGLHGLTYSEITRNGFSDGKKAMAQILDNQEAIRRSSVVSKVFAYVKKVGAKITLGEIERTSDEARDALMLLVVAVFVMERVQFTPSFAATFSQGEIGKYMPICKAVQKIFNDEYNIHVEGGRYILQNELSLEIGKKSFTRIKHIVTAVVQEAVQSELDWNEKILFKNGREFTGYNKELADDFVYFAATDVYNELGLPNPFKSVTKNPIKYMETWADMNKNQAAPQEEKTGNYLLGGFIRDDEGKKWPTANL